MADESETGTRSEVDDVEPTQSADDDAPSGGERDTADGDEPDAGDADEGDGEDAATTEETDADADSDTGDDAADGDGTDERADGDAVATEKADTEAEEADPGETDADTDDSEGIYAPGESFVTDAETERDDDTEPERDDDTEPERDDDTEPERDDDPPSVTAGDIEEAYDLPPADADERETAGDSTGDDVIGGDVDAPVSDADEDDDDDFFAHGLVGEGPDSDQEMPLAAHIEEMVRRLAVVLFIGGIVTLLVFPVADQLINFMWNAHIPGAAAIEDRRPRLYGPLELILTELKVAGLAGLIVGLPVLVYQTYLFMKPGLFPHERRYYLAAVPTSLLLALVGITFAHFVVLPAIFAYFTSYTEGTAVIAFGLRETFNLILILMGYMAIVFQIPLFIMLAIMMGLTTRVWMEDKRLLFWGGFLGLAFIVSPDPTGMAPIIVGATMIVLFEGTLALLRWTGN